jgi:vacuolar-type H+-ATPase subunit I/STV1
MQEDNTPPITPSLPSPEEKEQPTVSLQTILEVYDSWEKKLKEENSSLLQAKQAIEKDLNQVQRRLLENSAKLTLLRDLRKM